MQKKILEELYLNKKMTMQEIARELHCRLDTVVYAMRKYQIKRRSLSETNAMRFEKKELSFSIRKDISKEDHMLCIAGVMLYWAEGGKTGWSVDFVNSDSLMVGIFLSFLRTRYVLDESRLRAYIYCYSDQDINSLHSFWSDITKIPLSQFTKPYIKTNFKTTGRKMKYGMVHIRYSDKKLLLDILKLIEEYSRQSMRRW